MYPISSAVWTNKRNNIRTLLSWNDPFRGGELNWLNYDPCVLRLLQPRPQVLLVFQYGGGRREPVFFLYFQILHETH